MIRFTRKLQIIKSKAKLIEIMVLLQFVDSESILELFYKKKNFLKEVQI